MTERKKQAICPNCGQWNYKPPLYIRQKIGGTIVTEHYILYSMTKYKCTVCGTVWSERWDYDDN